MVEEEMCGLYVDWLNSNCNLSKPNPKNIAYSAHIKLIEINIFHSYDNLSYSSNLSLFK